MRTGATIRLKVFRRTAAKAYPHARRKHMRIAPSLIKISKGLIKRVGIIVAAFVIAGTVATVFLYMRVPAATTYTWNQTGTASWATSTNWTPTRTTPASDDILVFDNGATTTVTDVPSQTIGQLSVSGNTTVDLLAAVSTAKTLTLLDTADPGDGRERSDRCAGARRTDRTAQRSGLCGDG